VRRRARAVKTHGQTLLSSSKATATRIGETETKLVTVENLDSV
jgi:hypothetical protein